MPQSDKCIKCVARESKHPKEADKEHKCEDCPCVVCDGFSLQSETKIESIKELKRDEGKSRSQDGLFRVVAADIQEG